MPVGRAGARGKGAKGEKDVESIFEQAGFLQAQRSRAGRFDDRGDLAGIPDLTIEVKTYDDLARSIGDGMRDLVRERANNRTTWGVVFAKRRMKGWIAVLDGEEFARMYALLKEANGGTELGGTGGMAGPGGVQGHPEGVVVPGGELAPDLES